MTSSSQLKYVGSLSGQPGEDSNEESDGDPIALLKPVLLQDSVVQNSVQNNVVSSFDFFNETTDQFVYQTHESTIFEHKLEVDGSELSEFMEKIVITKNDPMHPETDCIENVLLHRRKMDNLELIIKTVATQDDEIIDYNLNANVYEYNESTISSRSMSRDELKRFKITWRKLWRPNYSNDELYDYALLDREKQSRRNSLYPITNNMDKNINISKLESRDFDYIKQRGKSQNSGNSNVINRSASSIESDKKSQSPYRNGSKVGPQTSIAVTSGSQDLKKNSVSKTGWETYIDPSERDK